jgi:hypothetical protein
VTSKNLDQLRSNGHGYIVGRNRRRSGEVFDYIQAATGPWIECYGIPGFDSGHGHFLRPSSRVSRKDSSFPGGVISVIPCRRDEWRGRL